MITIYKVQFLDEGWNIKIALNCFGLVSDLYYTFSSNKNFFIKILHKDLFTCNGFFAVCTSFTNKPEINIQPSTATLI